jgi:hypothetical protein
MSDVLSFKDANIKFLKSFLTDNKVKFKSKDLKAHLYSLYLEVIGASGESESKEETSGLSKGQRIERLLKILDQFEMGKLAPEDEKS